MVKISHYEVYTDRGDGWKLEDRFSSDQRYEAMRVAKEREAEKIAVKILKEDFDVLDNSYVETVEYVSLAGRKEKDKSGSDYSLKGGLTPSRGEYNIETQEPAGAVNGQNVVTAIFKLVAIIVFCLVSANILITLLIPVIEITVPEELARTVMFLTFFVLFLLLAVPLVLRKVPWYVFSSRKVRRKKIIHEKKFFDKADAIIQNYNLNDSYEPTLAPAFPEAPAEFKRYIVDYMSHVHNNRLIQAGLPASAIFIHKTGDIGKMLGDAGIVYTPNGKKYIVVMLVNRPYNSPLGKDFIVKASSLVYNYMVNTNL